MTERTGKPDESSGVPQGAPRAFPDYELADTLALGDPAQYRALFEETRQDIVRLLTERAATITELAGALGKPKGTVGHHVQVLADAGLVQVVRTERVRALEAKYWGRTARLFFYEKVGEAVTHGQQLLEVAAGEVGRLEASIAAGEDVPGVLDVNRRDVRIPHERAREFHHRLADLLMEFADEPRSGETTYAVVYGIFPSGVASLPGREGKGQ